MPFVAPPILPPFAIVRDFGECNWHSDSSWTDALLYRDPMRQLIGPFKVGDVHYKTLKPLHAIFEPPMNGKRGRFVASGLERFFVGYGKTLQIARKDWEWTVDAAIQNLLATLDFERTPEQQSMWSRLFHFFDLNEIRYAAPLKIKAYGRLVSVRGHKYRVRWIDGSKSTLTRNQIPSSMVGFRVGQPFDAVVLRDARTWSLVKVESAFAASSLPLVGESEATALLAPSPDRVVPTPLEWD